MSSLKFDGRRWVQSFGASLRCAAVTAAGQHKSPPGQRAAQEAKRIHLRAIDLAWDPSGSFPTQVQLLLALLEESEGAVVAALDILDIDPNTIRQTILDELESIEAEKGEI